MSADPPHQPTDLWPSDPDEAAALVVNLLHPGTDSWIGQPAELTRQITIHSGLLYALLEDESVWTLFEGWSNRIIVSGSVTLPPPPWAREEADTLLRTLGIPWPWVSAALVRLYFALLARAAGLPVPGQKASDLISVERVPVPAGTKRRRFQKDEGDQLFEWGAWWYRRYVRNESVRSLAIERHKLKGHPRSFTGSSKHEPCDCRSSIQYGLKQAERLLSLPPALPPLPK